MVTGIQTCALPISVEAGVHEVCEHGQAAGRGKWLRKVNRKNGASPPRAEGMLTDKFEACGCLFFVIISILNAYISKE